MDFHYNIIERIDFMPSYKKLLKGNKISWYTKFYYIDWTGTRRQKKKCGFATRREAQEWEREFLDKQNAAPDMSFGTLTEIYLADCKPRLKPTTMAHKENAIAVRILPYFKDFPICAITPAQVRNWQNTMLNAPCVKGGTVAPHYSPTYLKNLNAQLSAIFNFAVKFYRLSANPVRLAGSMGKQHSDKVNFWTRADISGAREMRNVQCVMNSSAAK